MAVLKSSPAKPWFVYILVCKDGTLYTGISPDVQARLSAHKAGKGAAYTKRGVKELAYQEELENKSEALKREMQIKKWSRQTKLAFINNSKL